MFVTDGQVHGGVHLKDGSGPGTGVSLLPQVSEPFLVWAAQGLWMSAAQAVQASSVLTSFTRPALQNGAHD